MEVTVSIKKANGELIEITREISESVSLDIIGNVEEEVRSIQEGILPLLSEQLVERHKSGFKGEKNQEEERE
jgi:hypothetical protein